MFYPACDFFGCFCFVAFIMEVKTFSLILKYLMWSPFHTAFYAIQSIPIPLLLFYSPLRYEKNILKNPQFVQGYTLLLSRQPAWTLQYSFNCQTAIFQGHLSYKKIYLERSHFSLIDFFDPQSTYHGNCAL